MHLSYIKPTLLLLIISLFFGCALFRPSPTKLLIKANDIKPYDAIIVTGVPFNGKSWSLTMEARSVWANYLFQNGYTKNIIYSGGSVYSKYIEAEILALYGEAMGIPKENIFIEQKAEHSTENLYYSYKMVKEMGFKTIALASDPFQTNQLRTFVKKTELPIDFIPVIFDTIAKIDRFEPSINHELAINDTFVSIKDKESFFKRFGGTLGKHIVWDSTDVNSEKQKKKLKEKGRLKL